MPCQHLLPGIDDILSRLPCRHALSPFLPDGRSAVDMMLTAGAIYFVFFTHMPLPRIFDFRRQCSAFDHHFGDNIYRSGWQGTASGSA